MKCWTDTYFRHVYWLNYLHCLVLDSGMEAVVRASWWCNKKTNYSTEWSWWSQVRACHHSGILLVPLGHWNRFRFSVCKKSTLLSTHADWQGVDISVTVCLFLILCVFFRISLPRIKLVVSNFARWFIGSQGREWYILGNFAPPEAQIWTNWPV